MPTMGTNNLTLGLAALYVVALILFASIPIVLDIAKAYAFAGQTRGKLIEQAAKGGLTAEELSLLLKELTQAPPGIPGLGRYTIASTVVMVLGIAIFHILANPEMANRSDGSMQVINTVLSLLAGTLSAIAGFYFGGRASDEAHKSAQLAAAGPSAGQRPGALGGAGAGARRAGLAAAGSAVVP